MPEMPDPNTTLRIVLAGSVTSSQRTLQALLRHGANVVGVLSLEPDASKNVSGYCNLKTVADDAGVECVEFRRINDTAVVGAVRKWSPDLFFVVGLSQLVGEELLALPRLGCIGFHPTHLPAGRGRAPIAWLTLDAESGAATFFLMDEGADSGPILAQEPFLVSPEDYAEDVMAKTEQAIDRALERWLPRLLAGEWQPMPQNHEAATYNARRGPEDGVIDWNWPAQQIHSLVRASSHPHPGAYTYSGEDKIIIWRAELEESFPIRGVVGRVVLAEEKGCLVQTGEGLLWLTEVELVSSHAQAGDKQWQQERLQKLLRVGARLGVAVQDEVQALKRHAASLEERLAELERLLHERSDLWANGVKENPHQ